MERYRIVRRERTSNSDKKWPFYIQRLRISLFGKQIWNDVEKKIGPNSDEISFKTYKDAEDFLLTNIIRGDGEIEVSGSIYTMTRYTYYV